MKGVSNRTVPDNGPKPKQKHHAKVFICDEKFVDIQKGLLQRGWSSNPVLGSPAYELKWRNYSRINFRLLRSTQVINHLFNAIHLSSKALVACHLQGPHRLHERTFFPRSWLPFRYSHIISLLNHLALFRSYSQLCFCAGAMMASKVTQAGARQRLADCLMCCELYIEYMTEQANSATPVPFHLPVPLLRRLLGLTDDIEQKGNSKKEAAEDESSAACEMGRVLERLRKADAHLSIYDDADLWADGMWIIKPCGGSCGRGIRVVASLPELLGELAARKYDCVVQKYIDRPLLLAGRKFDIRLWVLVTSVHPLVIWEFSRCYLRLSTKRFNARDVDDPYVHLCNHAVQKNHPDYELDPMWCCSRFRQWLLATYKEDVWRKRLRPALRRLVIDTLTSTQDVLERRGLGFEWLGLDVMVDEHLVPWLLEVNVSPDVSHSTSVTKPLAQAATADLLSMLFDKHEGGGREGDLGRVTSATGLPRTRLSPELRQHMARQQKGGQDKDDDRVSKVCEDEEGEEKDGEGGCWRLWHVGPVTSTEALKAVKEAKGSGKWEAVMKRERAQVAWGEVSSVAGLLDALGLNEGAVRMTGMNSPHDRGQVKDPGGSAKVEGGHVQEEEEEEEGATAAGEVEEARYRRAL